MRKIFCFITLCVFALALVSCGGHLPPKEPENPSVGGDTLSKVAGVYVLNQGNMGSNKCTLDYFDYTTGDYHKNIYGTINPEMVKELGDVGNDLVIYGSKLYAVVNVSGLIEVMDAATAKHLATINVPNCRYLTFDNGTGYVTSYAGPVDPSKSRLGYVAKFDTTTLSVIDTVVVGYQPEGIVAANGKLFVANSGGYQGMKGEDYGNTVSVIDVASFAVEREIEVGCNLNRLALDNRGRMFVASKGDYITQESKLYVVDINSYTVIDSLALSVSNMVVDGDNLYVICSDWSQTSQNNNVAFAKIDLTTLRKSPIGFITDDTQIEMPYGLGINPESGDIFVGDAKNYVMPGTVFVFDKEGRHKYHFPSGDIPSSFAFVRK